MATLPSLVHVGVVGKPHGVKGEVKVIPETDDPEFLVEIETLYLGDGAEGAVPLLVEGLRFQRSKKGLTLLVKLEGYDTPEAAAALRRKNVMVREEDVPLAEDEIFAEDLIGMEVLTEDGQRVGTVSDVLDMPAQVLYQVTKEDGSTSLIPGVADIVKKIDVDAGVMTIAPIEGLLE